MDWTAKKPMGAKSSKRVAPITPPDQPDRHSLVLWDVENCPVPNGTAASDAVSALRTWLASLGWPSQPPLGHVVAAYNVFASRAPTFWNQLKHAGVEQLAAGPKAEAADRELEQRLRREMRLLPSGEANTCVVLISGDMDFLAAVRDELRGRVTVVWVHPTNIRLPESTLRQIEEATRPSTCNAPRSTSALTTWEQLLSAHAPSSSGAATDDGSGGSGGGNGRSRSRSRSRSRGRNTDTSPSPGAAAATARSQQQPSPPPINSVPLGAQRALNPVTPPRSPNSRSPLPPLRSGSSSPLPLTTSPPGASTTTLTGTIQHWDGQPTKLWGYVVPDGQQQKHHFRKADVLEPSPAQIKVGMAVEFRASVNPQGGKHGGKPIAHDVRFVST